MNQVARTNNPEGRFSADKALQEVVADALAHPERAVPRRSRSTMRSGPGHASFCGKEEPHEPHRHANGKDDPDGYEVCEG